MNCPDSVYFCVSPKLARKIKKIVKRQRKKENFISFSLPIFQLLQEV